jgi:flagellar basal body rod protein FlgC
MKKVTIFSLLLLVLFLVNWALTASALAAPALGSAPRRLAVSASARAPQAMSPSMASVSIPTSAYILGSTADVCSEMRSEQMRLALLASNISNVNTTRTPEGGPYKPFEKIACVNGGCKFVRGKSVLYKYEPGHPDAGANGYVVYPNINIESSQRAFDMAASKLRLIANQKKCSTRILVNKDNRGRESSFMIHYLGSSNSIKEDIFNLNNGQVVSWARTDEKGEMTTLNLKR